MEGESYLLSDYDIHVQDFDVGSIPVEGHYEQLDGSHKQINYGAVYGQREITVPFYIKAYDMADYPLLRDKLFELTVTSDPVYLRELRRVNEVTTVQTDEGDKYVGGKQYKVRVTGNYELDQERIYGFGEITFETVELPFAESIGTTQDIENNGLRYSDELWSYGMGLQYGEETHKYTHEGSSFSIYNAGNVPIHPFEQELKITISNAQGSTKGLVLENKTNGTKFEVEEEVSSESKIVLDGANITRNKSQYLRKTNKQFIELEVGWNDFEIIKATSAKVEFDFKFNYK